MHKHLKIFFAFLSTFCVFLVICNNNRHWKHQMKLPAICKAGKVYTITKIQDLSENVKDLHCIYRVGEEPTSIPLGALVGFTLIIGNTYVFNPLLDVIWIGKYTMNVTCSEKTVFLGWNGVVGDMAFPYAMFIEKIHNLANIHPVWNDNKTSIILDYSRPLSSYCANYDDILQDRNNHMKIKRSAKNQMVGGLSFAVDGMRPVGRQKDGGLIYLGQIFLRDKYRSDGLTLPVAYFAVISYDESVEKHIKHAHALTPLNQDVRYFLTSTWDIFAIVFPLDNFFTEPIHSVKQFICELLTGIRNTLNIFKKIIGGLGGPDRKFFKQEIEKSLVLYQIFLKSQMNTTKRKAIFLSHPDDVHSHYNEL